MVIDLDEERDKRAVGWAIAWCECSCGHEGVHVVHVGPRADKLQVGDCVECGDCRQWTCRVVRWVE